MKRAMNFLKPKLCLCICFLNMTACNTTDPRLEELSPRPASHQLVSRDTHRLKENTVDILVYRFPVGGTLCSDNGEGNCKYWDGFDGHFDAQLHQSAANTRIAKAQALEAYKRHCLRVRPRADPVITEATVDFVRFQNGCHPR